MDLSHLRQQIDEVDRELIRLFVRRMEIAARIADYKKDHNLPVFIPAREEEKLLAVSEIAGPEMAEYTRTLFTSLFAISRDYQSRRNRNLTCGLLGRHLTHTYSPRIHVLLGDYDYNVYEKEPEELESFLRSGQFHGLNVTSPYKKAVIPYCSELTETAQKLVAVNTILRKVDGKLLGHNTDASGFRAMVAESGLAVSGKKVLVLGSGGASNTAAAVMKELGAHPVVISRSGENNYGNLFLHADAAVIVNATPVGMYPATDASPVDLEHFPRLEGVLDLIYNPARTKLLMDAETRGLISVNGLHMLVAQARESAEMFTDTSISDAVVTGICSCLKRQTLNLILVGMPGCGKTTVGKFLAQKLGRPFADTDALVEEASGMSIPEIFSREGEAGFRIRETAALEELGKQSGLVIATGGGCVTKPENYPHLHRNGVIVWLRRDTGKLPTDGRPLSSVLSAEEMYTRRKPLYEAFADHAIDNNNAEDAADAIIRIWEESL